MALHSEAADRLMSRSQIRNATGDSFFAWEGAVLVVNNLGVKSRLFIDSFDEQIRFLLPPGLERLNWSLMMQGALRDAVVVG